MDEREFTVLADAMLARIEVAIDDLDAGVELDVQPGGVLEIEMEQGTKIIINRHVAAREIWLAAPSGGYHFRPDQGKWLGTRDGEELLEVLGKILSEQTGTAIRLA